MRRMRLIHCGMCVSSNTVSRLSDSHLHTHTPHFHHTWQELDLGLVVSIDCSDGALEDLKALSKFPRLTSLVADANNITSLDALPTLPKLQVRTTTQSTMTHTHSHMPHALTAI